MTIEEAKQRLTYINRAYDYGDIYSRDDLVAIDTVLKALHNSISKEEVRKKIEQLEFLRDDAIEDNFLGDARNLKERIDILQELLGEE